MNSNLMFLFTLVIVYLKNKIKLQRKVSQSLNFLTISIENSIFSLTQRNVCLYQKRYYLTIECYNQMNLFCAYFFNFSNIMFLKFRFLRSISLGKL